MSTLVKNILRFVLFLMIQIFVLDKLVLHQMVTPYIYFLFLLWLPINLGRIWQLLLGVALGLTLDSFRHQPGFHMSACVLVAYVRPFLLNLLIPLKEDGKNSYLEPTLKSLGGFTAYFIYCAVLTLLHNGWLFLLEAWQWGSFWYFLIKTLLSTLITLIIFLITELFFARNQIIRLKSK